MLGWRRRCRGKLLWVLLAMAMSLAILQMVLPSMWPDWSTAACLWPDHKHWSCWKQQYHSAKLDQHVRRKTPAPSHSEIPATVSSPKIKAVRPQSLWALERQISGRWRWQWIMARIKQSWPEWLKALDRLNQKKGGTLDGRQMKEVLVVPGLLRTTKFAEADAIHSGAPLGDLVQWADLIAAVYVLGHNVTLNDDFYDAGRWLLYGACTWKNAPNCPNIDFDLVFADIITMKTFPADVIAKYRSRFRVVDAYGSEAMYNNPDYAAKHGYSSLYGGLGLNLKQFYTFYPHSPDNSFLGFVVYPPRSKPQKEARMGLLYGKDPVYFKEMASYIEMYVPYVNLHATLRNTSVLPSGVINHGIVSSGKYQQLLARAKLLIGVGLPLESSGALEALAQGCIFINPQFKQEDQDILQRDGKPTTRKITSQVPYLAERVDRPYVYSPAPWNQSQVQNVVKTALKTQVKPFIPYEFTLTGFLQRLNIYIERQNFTASADVVPSWPPEGALHTVLARPNISCKVACQLEGLRCQPEFFPVINSEKYLQSHIPRCAAVARKPGLAYPAVVPDTGHCLLQTDALLFSCVGQEGAMSRLCPCSRPHKKQSALCELCLDSTLGNKNVTRKSALKKINRNMGQKHAPKKSHRTKG